MVRDKHSFPQQRLSLAVLKCFKEIRSRVDNKRSHTQEIADNLTYRSVPILFATFSGRPVIVWKYHLLVIWIDAEVENVPLRQSNVLEQLPGRVRKASNLFVNAIEWKSFQCRLDIDVGGSPGKQF